MFTVTMLPASVGDSIWIEYGQKNDPRRILIDCGTPPTYRMHLKKRLEALGPNGHFELLVITHIDTDHIGGVLPLVASLPPGVTFGEVWFNAWKHLQPTDALGPVDGEVLTRLIELSGIPWNKSFRARDHAARTPPAGQKLVARELPGGMKLTVVAPSRTELDILKAEWKDVVEAAGLVPGLPSKTLTDKAKKKGIDLLGPDPIPGWADYDPTDLDDTEANGSSIAVLAEFEEGGVTKRCLLAGDAHGPVLTAGIKRLARQREQERLRVDAFKLPHHGSVRNVTRDLIRAVDARQYLFSTNSGARHGHPHKEAVARVLVDGTRPSSLKFNYRSKINERWDNGAWKQKYGYDTEYGDGSLTVTL